MAFLLGSEYCIQSLSNDVIDIQSSIKNIIAKTGKINSISWKFPDKNACDLNIDDLIETYKYDSNDSENNQVAHIILLELLIDRISLLLQLNCEYLDNLLNSNPKSASNDRKNSGKLVSPCIGLIVKKHLNKFSNLPSLLDNMKKEIKLLKNQTHELNEQLTNSKIEKVALQKPTLTKSDNISKQAEEWLSSLEQEQRVDKSIQIKRKSVNMGIISKDFGCKSSQTLDTAFKPCESCYISQSCLKELCSLIVKVLHGDMSKSDLLGISQSASVGKLSSDFSSSDWLTDKQLYQLKDGIGRDVEKVLLVCRKLKKEKEHLANQISELSNQLEQMNEWKLKEEKEQKRKFKEFEEEKLDLKNKLDKTIQDYESSEKELQRRKENHSKEVEELEKNIKKLKEELVLLKPKEVELDSAKSYLTNHIQISGSTTEPLIDIIKKLDQSKNKYKIECESLQKELDEMTKIRENLTDKDDKIKMKQEQLVKRLQSVMEQKKQIDEEMEEMKKQLDESQNQLVILSQQNKQLIREKSDLTKSMEANTKELQNQIDHLQLQNNQLILDLDSLKHQNQVLINYPDVNGPIENCMNKTEDLAQDLKLQLESNSIRIRMLQEQNTSFQMALEKLNNSNQHADLTNGRITPCIERNSSTMQSMSAIDHPLPPPSSSSLSAAPGNVKPLQLTSSRCTSARNRRTVTPVGTATILNAISTNRNEVYTKPPTPTLIHWSSIPPNHNGSNKKQQPQQFTCESCGRQYPQKTDLQIHKDYCAGRRKKR